MNAFTDKSDENGRRLSRRVENTVGKGEIACYKQFLLFPQCFQKAGFSGASKGVIVWEWVKQVQNERIYRQQNRYMYNLSLGIGFGEGKNHR